MQFSLYNGDTKNEIKLFDDETATETGEVKETPVSKVWKVLSAKTSMAIYVGVILALLISVIITAMISEHRRPMLVDTDEFKAKLVGNGNVGATLGGVPATENGVKEKKKEEDEDKIKKGNRFFMLKETDERMKGYKKPEEDKGITLKRICESFRNFSAYKLKLYYSEEDIRKFIAGLSVTHIVLMQGMSGTGKTSLAYAFGEYLKNQSTIVPIQPMWKERTDLIGYYNEFTKRFNETVLLQKMYEANYSDEIYVTVLDEMNIARVEYYFAEFLSLLEIPNAESRYIEVVSDKWEGDPLKLKDGQIKLPENMWFIGTANNDDSTFAISDKVYDRAMVMNLDKKAKAFEGKAEEGIRLTFGRFKELIERAKKEYEISERNIIRIGRLDRYMIETYHVSFGNRIMKQIREYVPVSIACGGDELEAIDDILSKKVIRKLEAQNPIYVRNTAGEFREYLDELFGTDKMPLCKESLTRLERTV